MDLTFAQQKNNSIRSQHNNNFTMLKVNCKKYIDRYIAREREVLQKKKVSLILVILFTDFRPLNHFCFLLFLKIVIITAQLLLLKVLSLPYFLHTA